MLDRFIIYVCAASALLLALIMLTSCDGGSSLTETHNAENIDFTINVHTYENESALNKAVSEVGYDSDPVEGLAQVRVDAIGNIKRCDIYVVKPRTAKSYNTMETWGHELMHCTYGLYHKEGER